MYARLRTWFIGHSLAQQFRLVSFFILAVNMLGIGWWIGGQIERRVIHQTATTTALYVDSFIAPHLQTLGETGSLTAEQQQRLSWQMENTPLGRRIVAFKIWNTEGRILYSTTPSLIDRRFPVQGGLARALRGEVTSEISQLDEDENLQERQHWPELLETYSPIRLQGTQAIIGAVEFYQTVDDLKREVRAAQWHGWLVVGLATGLMYLLLAGIVHRGSETIKQQQATLHGQIAQLTDLLTQNKTLHERVRRAATRTASLNERLLRRISAELHDGPVQTLSYALLQLDNVVSQCGACAFCNSEARQTSAILDAIQGALRQTLEEMRTIAKGLHLPELNNLSLTDILARVVREHKRRTHTEVELTCDGLPEQAPLSTKITLYRLVQEALSNAYRHGKGVGQQVRVCCENESVHVGVSDQGPGFDRSAVMAHDDRLGLAGMRERVESLGGQFDVKTAPGQGTTVTACLSLNAEEETYA